MLSKTFSMLSDASLNLVHDDEFAGCTTVAKRALRHELLAAYWGLGLKLGLAGQMKDARQAPVYNCLTVADFPIVPFRCTYLSQLFLQRPQ